MRLTDSKSVPNSYSTSTIHVHLCSALRRAALVMTSKFLPFPFPVPCSPSVPSTSWTYASRSSHRNLRGFRASTICTIRWERSMTLHSCLHTSRLRSKGVNKNLSRSCNLRKSRSERRYHNKCDTRAVRTQRDLSATGEMSPFPDVPIVPGL
jgi:hypothetical protein